MRCVVLAMLLAGCGGKFGVAECVEPAGVYQVEFVGDTGDCRGKLTLSLPEEFSGAVPLAEGCFVAVDRDVGACDREAISQCDLSGFERGTLDTVFTESKWSIDGTLASGKQHHSVTAISGTVLCEETIWFTAWK